MHNAYLEQTYLAEHNAKFAMQAEESADRHRSVEAFELDAALCPSRDRRVVDKSGCVSWRGRRLALTGVDASPRRRREVLVRERLDGQVELTTLDGRAVLSSREVVEPAKAPATQTPAEQPASLVERGAGQGGPKKPAKDHPWRSPFVGAGSAAAPTNPQQRGQFYSVEKEDTSTSVATPRQKPLDTKHPFRDATPTATTDSKRSLPSPG